METQTLHKHLLPAQRDGHNWDAIKMRYCLLGEDLTVLAREYGIVEEFLVRLAESEEWVRQDIPDIIQAVENDDPIALMEAVKTRVDTIQVYKELALLPSLLEIESSLVSNLKAALSTNKKHTPKEMKLLVDAFSALTSRQQIFNRESGSTVPNVTMNMDMGEGGADAK